MQNTESHDEWRVREESAGTENEDDVLCAPAISPFYGWLSAESERKSALGRRPMCTPPWSTDE